MSPSGSCPVFQVIVESRWGSPGRKIHSTGAQPSVLISDDQNRKFRTLVFVAATDPQFTANLFDKTPNNSHSQSFATDWIKSLRQTGTLVGDRQEVAFFRIGLHAECYLACAVFGCIRDQFVSNEAQRNGDSGGQIDFNS